MSTRNFSEPACHSYLGEQLKDSRRRGTVEVVWEKEYRLLLIPLVDIVLFPGETIPLRLQDQNIVSHVKRIIRELESNPLGAENNEDLMIGVVNNPRTGRGRQNLVGWFGTTIEVRSSSCTPLTSIARSYIDHNRSTEEVVLTGRGQYRFQIIRMQHVGSGVNYATVKLFDEQKVKMTRSIPDINPFPPWVYEMNAPATLAKKAFQMVETALFWKAESSTLLSRWGLICTQSSHTGSGDSVPNSPSSSGASRNPKRTRTSNTVTNTAFDTTNQTSDSNTTIHADNNTVIVGDTPSARCRLDKWYAAQYGAELDPVGFSYFLAANLPVSNEQLQSLLEACDVVDRLRLCMKYLEMGTGKVLACGVCRAALASKQQVFSVPGAEGVTGAYVNPHGAVHQTITVRDVLDPRAVLLHGRPCTEDSWFPGYAWTIASCARCLNHLGWRFTLVTPVQSAQSTRSSQSVTAARRALPAALVGFAGTPIEELWRNLLQGQGDDTDGLEEDEEDDEDVQEEEEEEWNESEYSGSDVYSGGDYYEEEEVEEGEEDAMIEGENGREESEEGDEINDDRRSIHSGSEHSSTHSDRRDVFIGAAEDAQEVSVEDNARSTGRASSEENGEGEQGNSVEEDDNALLNSSSSSSVGNSADEGGGDRVVSFWGLRRSGLVEA